MPKIYDFSRLIDKYGVTFEMVTKAKGEYSGGVYKEGKETVTPVRGAIIPLSESKIYRSGGSLTSKDRQLYYKGKFVDALRGATVRYKGSEYAVETETDYQDYADFCVYTLRWVSSFD